MHCDLLIIGSGPGGYVAAIRASQLGLKVIVVEKEELGGICLNWGCIPTKALLKTAQVYNYIQKSQEFGIDLEGEAKPNFEKIISRSRAVAQQMSKGVQFLFKKNNIQVIKGFGRIIKVGEVEVQTEQESLTISTKNIIVATGARSREIAGLKQDKNKVLGYKDALSLKHQPKSLIVVGSGAIGCEFAYFFNSIGTKVTLVEFMPNIVPLEDEDISKQLEKTLQKAGIEIHTSTTLEGIEKVDNHCIAIFKNKEGKIQLSAEMILSAVGIVPNIENTGVKELGIELEKGKIKVDGYYQTTIAGIYAIGDIINTPALAHVASAEGIICVEKIAGHSPNLLNYQNIPSCIYTDPEIASIGMTEKHARENGIDIKIGKFPFMASGKASAVGAREGFIKLIADAKYGEIIGAHMIGYNVTELISEISLGRNLEITAKEILKTIHPHPTMSEAIMESASVILGEAIHI